MCHEWQPVKQPEVLPLNTFRSSSGRYQTQDLQILDSIRLNHSISPLRDKILDHIRKLLFHIAEKVDASCEDHQYHRGAYPETGPVRLELVP